MCIYPIVCLVGQDTLPPLPDPLKQVAVYLYLCIYFFFLLLFADTAKIIGGNLKAVAVLRYFQQSYAVLRCRFYSDAVPQHDNKAKNSASTQCCYILSKTVLVGGDESLKCHFIVQSAPQHLEIIMSQSIETMPLLLRQFLSLSSLRREEKITGIRGKCFS